MIRDRVVGTHFTGFLIYQSCEVRVERTIRLHCVVLMFKFRSTKPTCIWRGLEKFYPIYVVFDVVTTESKVTVHRKNIVLVKLFKSGRYRKIRETFSVRRCNLLVVEGNRWRIEEGLDDTVGKLSCRLKVLQMSP